MNSPVYDHFRLHISVDNFYLVPYANEASTLVIDRVSNEINVERGVFNIPPTTNKSKVSFKMFLIFCTLSVISCFDFVILSIYFCLYKTLFCKRT